MLLTESYVDIATPSGTMRCFVCVPKPPLLNHHQPQQQGQPAHASPTPTYPAILVYSEIYQVTGPIQRLCRWLAGHGYLAIAGDVYHEYEPPGRALAYDDAGTDRGNALKVEKEVHAYDADTNAMVAWLLQHPNCNQRIGSVGLCLGGHLAFRASFHPTVLASACFFATDIHSATLGRGKRDDTLQRVRAHAIDPSHEVLMMWGKQDTHIPPAGRALIYSTLHAAHVNVDWVEVNAQHAFLRDEFSKGRYDPALADACKQLMLELFERCLRQAPPVAQTARARL